MSREVPRQVLSSYKDRMPRRLPINWPWVWCIGEKQVYGYLANIYQPSCETRNCFLIWKGQIHIRARSIIWCCTFDTKWKSLHSRNGMGQKALTLNMKSELQPKRSARIRNFWPSWRKCEGQRVRIRYRGAMGMEGSMFMSGPWVWQDQMGWSNDGARYVAWRLRSLLWVKVGGQFNMRDRQG